MNNQLTLTKNYSPTRARSFNVKTTGRDYAQYANTIRAYALAGMPFEHIANAGDHLGDEVERLELDAPIQESWKTKIGEIAEEEGAIMAWQTRGEVVSISHQLPQSNPITGLEVVTVSQDLTITNDETTIDVVEGIAVSTTSSKLENNIFLQPHSLT